ncbi:dihydroorotase [Salinimicrobium sp. TH3]|uniref:dihydroorotase n=1 Tax=Salinimicrobium sp. TH3 TaxID=2997342 RepID=UPI002273415F|nr:dihydroorotase [Salinimicrobium sp. TH3]MCY2686215.1 dihydroorotase [Salinimicrobium sp. TH3]
MKKVLIKNAKIVNEGSIFEGDVFIEDGIITEIASSISAKSPNLNIVDAEGNYLLPGVIDDQVHFREPGLTHKETIETGSKAAVAGGITSFIEMPNTNPQTTTIDLLEEKYKLAEHVSYANYAFMFGGTNDNLEEIKKIDPKTVPALKLFLGSSTGNMLVDDEKVLEMIFKESPVLIAAHCEDEKTIQNNLQEYKEQYGDDIPIEMHPKIRSEEACFLSSSRAVALAKKTGARLHVFHLSTAKELKLFDSKKPLKEKMITAEVCVHHLWFNDSDYKTKGTFIKWNPAVKTEKDQEALLKALIEDKIDVIATDHAPHTREEKKNVYTKAPSGGPLVQHALPAMLQMHHQGKISLEKIVEKMCHNPAILFDIEKRGFIREGYKADLVLVDLNAPWAVQPGNTLYKCGWSPFEGTTFKSRVTHTFVNGNLVYKNFNFTPFVKAERLKFDR